MKTLSPEQGVEFPLPYAPPARYPRVRRSARYIPMSDGVRIALDLTLPDPLEEGAQIPAILLQTRYWRSVVPGPEVQGDPDDPLSTAKMSAYKRRFLAQGYAWVDIDVRGTGASFGHRLLEFSDAEVKDGGQVVDWIIRQPWSNGVVGALGISYEGTTAELLLANCHPAVRAVAPMFSFFDAYPDVAFPGGMRADWFLDTWGYFNELLDHNEVPEETQAAMLGVQPVDEDVDGSLLAAAVQEHRQNVPLHAQLAGIAYRDDRPASGAVERFDAISPASKQDLLAASEAAVYSISGWFDGAYPQSAVNRFLALPNRGGKLLIGPWNHGGGTNISPYGGGPSRFDLPGELLKFFDHHLKGIETGIELEKPVHYFTMGAETWKSAETWPPAAAPTPFYFAPSGELQTTPPQEDGASDPYQVDFSAGTSERARWNSLIGMPLENPYPGRPEQDSRLLCYTSAPLAQDCEVSGHAVVELYLQPDGPEADVFVYLEDVDPGGQVVYVTEGLLRASQRKLAAGSVPYRPPAPLHTFRRQDALPVQPGETLHLVIDLIPTSYVFRRDHAIRLALAGADRDHFEPSEDASSNWQMLRSKACPSHLVLPVVGG